MLNDWLFGIIPKSRMADSRQAITPPQFMVQNSQFTIHDSLFNGHAFGEVAGLVDVTAVVPLASSQLFSLTPET
jgi:hypothetical protein